MKYSGLIVSTVVPNEYPRFDWEVSKPYIHEKTNQTQNEQVRIMKLVILNQTKE